MKGNTSQAMKDLLMQSAKQKEQEVKETTSVAANPETETTENNPSAMVEETVEAEEKQPKDTAEPSSNEPATNANVRKRKFSDYLQDRKIKKEILGLPARPEDKRERSHPHIQRHAQDAQAHFNSNRSQHVHPCVQHP